jgi:hypothetical protein
MPDVDFHDQLEQLVRELAAAQERRRLEQQGKFFIAALKTLMVWFLVTLVLFFGHRLFTLDWLFYKQVFMTINMVAIGLGGMVFVAWVVTGGAFFTIMADEFKPLPKGYYRK